jgi:hypothetical protein
MKRIVLAIRDIWNLQYRLHLLNFVYRKEVTKGCVQCTCRMLLVVLQQLSSEYLQQTCPPFQARFPPNGRTVFRDTEGVHSFSKFLPLEMERNANCLGEKGKGSKKRECLDAYPRHQGIPPILMRPI